MEMQQGVWKQHLRPRAVVGYGLKIFLPSPPNYVTRSPGSVCFRFFFFFLPFQVIFEPSEGATPNSLRQFVSGVCDIPLDRLNIAKYLRQKCDWLVISDTFSRQVCALLKFIKT